MLTKNDRMTLVLPIHILLISLSEEGGHYVQYVREFGRGRGYDLYSHPNQFSQNQAAYTIIVEGQGNTTVQPDQAVLTIGIVTENEDVEKAQQENASKTNHIIELLNQVGIEQDDIKTTAYLVNPRYDYVEGKSVLRGYEVGHSLQVTVKDILKVGMVYDIAIKNGANQTGELQFQSSYADFHYRQALTLAVNDARQKAQQIAKTIGVTLNHVPFRITEESRQPIQPYFASGAPLILAAQAKGMATPIQTGELMFQADVKVVFGFSVENY